MLVISGKTKKKIIINNTKIYLLRVNSKTRDVQLFFTDEDFRIFIFFMYRNIQCRRIFYRNGGFCVNKGTSNGNEVISK